MKKSLFVISVLSAILLSTSCSSIKILVDGIQDAESITEENEYYIGRSVSAAVLSKYNLYTNSPKTTRYLNQICKALIAASDNPYIYNDYCVGIIDTNDINALSTPGGHIFISRGLLDCADSEDALAAIIAHEVAHIQLKHCINAVKASKYVNAVTSFSKDVYEKATEDVDIDAASAEDVRNFVNCTNDMTETLVNSGFSQNSEFEADALALQLMNNAGYDPNTMITMLEKIQSNTKSKASSSGWNKTHPDPKDRIKEVNGKLKKISFTGSDKSVRQSRFENNRL